MTEATHHLEVIKNLEQEILLNPELRHRLVLKAIKTAKSKEARKMIRTFYKTSFQGGG
ncbi:MAG: hypothetical protein AAGA02_01655 [Bacteroidota bacterium]